MGRPATGSIAWRLNPETGAEQWYARVTFPNGSRRRVELDPNIPEHDERAARAAAKVASNRARGIGSPSETVRSWFERYYAMREARGDRSVKASRSRFALHIGPLIGDKAMSAITPDDLRVVVRYIESEVNKRRGFYAHGGERVRGRKPGMAHGQAQNVWGEITVAFSEAHKSNDDAFRVCKSNPAAETKGPPSGKDREQAALFPSELLALLSCEKVRLDRRRAYAVAAYAGLRSSEVRALRASDVDLEHQFINVRGQTKKGATARTTTKTSAGLRQIPIEPALVPLLTVLVAARKTGPLLRIANASDVSHYVRRDLERAELTRDELVADDATRKPFTFHGLRHTYLTHLAMRPGASEFMLAAAGHTDLATSQRYIASGNLLRQGRAGDPFPPLPPDLYEMPVDGIRVSAFVSDSGSPRSEIRQEIPANQRPQWESKRRPDSSESIEKPAASSPTSASSSGSRNAPSVTADDGRSNAEPVDLDAVLVRAIDGAVVAGRFDVVAQLAKELEARRLSHASNVVPLKRQKR